jgi:RNA polymerase subunit RPABC4/transcription elongation factor Spt4
MNIIQPILSAAQAHDNQAALYWWQQKSSSCDALAPQPGDQCPVCGKGVLDYDSLFLLTCKQCGQVVESGAFT